MSFWRRKKPQRTYYVRPKPHPWYQRPRRRPVLVSRRTQRSIVITKIRTVLQNCFSHFLYRTVAILTFLVALLVIGFSTLISIKHIEVVRHDLHINSARVENALKDYRGKSILLTRKSSMAQKIAIGFPEFSSIRIKKILPDRIQINLKSHPYVANLRAYHQETKEPALSSYEFSALNQAIQELAEKKQTPFVPPLAVTEAAIRDEKPLPAMPANPEATLETDTPLPAIEPSSLIVEQKGLLNAIGQAIFDQEESLELMNIVIRDLDRPVLDREQVISRDHMTYILESIDYLQSGMNLTIEGITYFPAARDIHLKTKKGFLIWLTLGHPYSEQIDKLRTIYERAELDKEELLYIDLRIREKVIYCPARALCRKLTNE